MKAVYTLWEDSRKKINGGFGNQKDLATFLYLSVMYSKKQFDTVELVTNKAGKEIVESFKIPFDDVKVVLDGFDHNLDPDLWAYAKLYSYSIQDEPFIHIDNDVILWDKVPEETLKQDLFFQNKEHLSDHLGYVNLLRLSASHMPKKLLQYNPVYAYNCGVVGANNLDIIRDWFHEVTEYLFGARNNEFWQHIKDKHSQNHLFEQYFISALIERNKMQNKVGTLLKDDFYASAVRDFKMTHLWGLAKRSTPAMERIRTRLYTEFPETEEIFEPNLATHTEIFTDIYNKELWGKGQGSGGGSTIEITETYRNFLQRLLSELDIDTVADFGCGDWNFSHLIDWTGVHYVGYDCVDAILHDNKEQYGNKDVYFKFIDDYREMFKADLLIVKDVLIHWNNEEIQNFFDWLKTCGLFKYVLITNQTGEENLNQDIKTGQFHNIDILSDPFNVEVQKQFVWDNDEKTTYLLRF